MNMNVYGPIILTAVFGVVMYVLYSKGMMVSKSIRAILFYFVPGKDGDRVRVGSCTGWVKHMVRLCEGQTYEFRFDAQLSSGNVEVILLDGKKQQLLRLDPFSPRQTVGLDRTGRYFLRWKFTDATGQCELHW